MKLITEAQRRQLLENGTKQHQDGAAPCFSLWVGCFFTLKRNAQRPSDVEHDLSLAD